jgi:hypothetical protein
MNIINILYTLLQEFSLPIFLQGSIGEDERYPEQFFTYWIEDSEGNSFYDNEDHTTDWSINTIFYTDDITKVGPIIAELIEKLKAKGFKVQGKGFLTMSDEPTHIGWIVEATYSEQN